MMIKAGIYSSSFPLVETMNHRAIMTTCPLLENAGHSAAINPQIKGLNLGTSCSAVP